MAKYTTAAICAVAFYRSFSSGGEMPAQANLLASSVFAFSVVFIASGIASQLGRSLEGYVDMVEACSYLKLNRGDEKVIKSIGRSNIKSYVGVGASIVGALVLNIFATWLAYRFGIGK